VESASYRHRVIADLKKSNARANGTRGAEPVNATAIMG
jgi:hypothetical protein